jgi:hypothetical protein
MKIHLIIELPLGDSEPYVTPYTSAAFALADGPAEYENALKDRDVKGKAKKIALAAFRHDLEKNGVYYCEHSESVYYLMEREVIEPPPVKGKTRWHVLTHMAGGAENCWTDTNEQNETWPLTFATKREALAELRIYLADQRGAFEEGHIDSVPKRSEFTIERVTA